jgi:LysM repeat protein
MLYNKHVRLSIRLIVCVALFIALVGVVPSGNQSVFAQGGDNLLQNPGFEGNYIAIGGNSNTQVAPSWQPWHLPPPAGAATSINLEPDYQPAPADRVKSGSAAQEYNTFFATHIGGVFQRVPVTPGSVLRFSASLYPYSSADFEDPDQSINPQGVHVSVGIDPNGGTDGASNSIIWSTPAEYYDEYRELSVSTTAVASSVTVFVRSSVDNPTGLHQVFVDDADLRVVSQTDITPDVTETVETETPVTVTQETPDVTVTTPPPVTQETAEPSEEPDTDEPATSPTARTPYSDDLPNELVHTVVFGDTIIGLALQYESTIDAIIEYNGLSANGLIFVNQSLLVPVPSDRGTPVAPLVTPIPTTATTDGSGGAALPANGIYVVQAGDNLFRIALSYNLTVETLAQFNNILNPAQIFVGQEIRIPTGDISTAQPVPAQPIGGTNNTEFGVGGVGNTVVHTVATGENVFRIGLRYNVTVDVIARANGLINPNLIFVGQQLVIPQ